jgi:hypothetical protein
LLGECHGKPLADLLAKGRRASGLSVVELAIEGGDHPARIIAGECGKHGGKRTFLNGADLSGAGRRGAHVLRISMRC